MDWFWEAPLHSSLAELSLQRGDVERATTEASAALEAAAATPERTWRSRAHVTAALVALERQAFEEARQHLRQARLEVRGSEAPLVTWRIEAVTATLLEKTAQHESASRARQKYERARKRLDPPSDRPDEAPQAPQTRPPGTRPH